MESSYVLHSLRQLPQSVVHYYFFVFVFCKSPSNYDKKEGPDRLLKKVCMRIALASG